MHHGRRVKYSSDDEPFELSDDEDKCSDEIRLIKNRSINRYVVDLMTHFKIPLEKKNLYYITVDCSNTQCITAWNRELNNNLKNDRHIRRFYNKYCSIGYHSLLFNNTPQNRLTISLKTTDIYFLDLIKYFNKQLEGSYNDSIATITTEIIIPFGNLVLTSNHERAIKHIIKAQDIECLKLINTSFISNNSEVMDLITKKIDITKLPKNICNCLSLPHKLTYAIRNLKNKTIDDKYYDEVNQLLSETNTSPIDIEKDTIPLNILRIITKKYMRQWVNGNGIMDHNGNINIRYPDHSLEKYDKKLALFAVIFNHLGREYNVKQLYITSSDFDKIKRLMNAGININIMKIFLKLCNYNLNNPNYKKEIEYRNQLMAIESFNPNQIIGKKPMIYHLIEIDNQDILRQILKKGCNINVSCFCLGKTYKSVYEYLVDRINNGPRTRHSMYGKNILVIINYMLQEKLGQSLETIMTI